MNPHNIVQDNHNQRVQNIMKGFVENQQDVIITTESSLNEQMLKGNIVSIVNIKNNNDMLQKAWGHKDVSKLEKKIITTKDGKTMTVYVRHHEAGHTKEFQHGDKVAFEHKGKQLSGTIQKLKHHEVTDKFGTAEIIDEHGNKYSKSLRAIDHHDDKESIEKKATPIAVKTTENNTESGDYEWGKNVTKEPEAGAYEDEAAQHLALRDELKRVDKKTYEDKYGFAKDKLYGNNSALHVFNKQIKWLIKQAGGDTTVKPTQEHIDRVALYPDPSPEAKKLREQQPSNGKEVAENKAKINSNLTNKLVKQGLRNAGIEISEIKSVEKNKDGSLKVIASTEDGVMTFGLDSKYKVQVTGMTPITNTKDDKTKTAEMVKSKNIHNLKIGSKVVITDTGKSGIISKLPTATTDQYSVDFGNGNIYGIMPNRIKPFKGDSKNTK